MWSNYISRASGQNIVYDDFRGFYQTVVSAITMTVGTIFLMWIGEQIDEYGIGNGISLLIMAGIIARIPQATQMLVMERGHLRASIFMLGGSGVGGDIGLGKLIILIIPILSGLVAAVSHTNEQ